MLSAILLVSIAISLGGDPVSPVEMQDTPKQSVTDAYKDERTVLELEKIRLEINELRKPWWRIVGGGILAMLAMIVIAKAVAMFRRPNRPRV